MRDRLLKGGSFHAHSTNIDSVVFMDLGQTIGLTQLESTSYDAFPELRHRPAGLIVAHSAPGKAPFKHEC